MKKLGFFLTCGVLLLISVNPSIKAEKPPETIYCHCTLLGACKASGAGSLCAQGEQGGNIHCDQYSGNC